jgi:hypothetical protein
MARATPMTTQWTLRVTRPTDRLHQIAEMYRIGLGFATVDHFADHDGFDGIILGHPGQPYHLEFTAKRGHAADDEPSSDQLLVFFVPDAGEWQARCASMLAAGFREVASFNPYWSIAGRTFEDLDHCRVVLQASAWSN